jgi:hypothetical protein
MSPALSSTPAADWALPLERVLWRSFSGQYQYAGAPSTDETTTGETAETGPPEPVVTVIEPLPTEPPPATTGEPPPSDTGLEPPPATTSAADTGVAPQ